MLDGRVEVVGAVGVLVEELGSGGCGLAERIHATVGEGVVGCAFGGIVLRALIGGVLVFIVGCNPGHALVAGVVVGLIACPDVGIVVDVEDEESLTGNAGIPSRLLAVLEKEVFVGVALVIDNVGAAALLQGFQVADLSGCGELNGLFPTSHPAFVGGVACGLITVAIVGA